MALFLFSLAKAALAHFFLLKPAPFCTLFCGLGSTNKSASSLFLLSDSRSVLATLSSPPSFLLSQTLGRSGRNCPLSLLQYYQVTMGTQHSFLPGYDATDELASRGALLVPSAIPRSLSLISRIHSCLFSNWRRTISCKFFDTQVLSIFTGLLYSLVMLAVLSLSLSFTLRRTLLSVKLLSL